MNLGIFGGTFNPVHMGHISASLSFYDDAGLDMLLIIPDRIPPHKEGTVASASYRLAMLRLVYENKNIIGDRSISVSEIELRREGKSYTIVTLRELKEKYPDAKLFLYTGSDMFYTLESWREGESILRMCSVYTCAREENEKEKLYEYAELYRKKYGTQCIVSKNTPLVLSSTLIRAQINDKNAKKTCNFTNNILTDEVKEYIIRNSLYSEDTENTSDSLICRISDELPGYIGEKRLSHVIAVKETAELLAGFLISLGAELDIGKVSIAALLHDISKYMNQEELCEKYGIPLSEDDISSKPTLHAITGAYFAKNTYGIDDEIFEAIKNHSVGAENMSLTDKIIFVSDYCEETRSFDECRKSREMMLEFISRREKDGDAYTLSDALRDLDYLAADIFGKTIIHLKKSQSFVHSGTKKSFEWIIKSRESDSSFKALYEKYIQ